MTKELKNRVHRVYGIVLSAVTVMAGVCLMAACLSIYLSGDEPFTRDSVAAAFSTIAIPVYLCLALVIGGIIMDLFLPADAKKDPVQRQDALILQRLREKADLSQPSLRNSVEAEEKSRRLHRTVCGCLLALGCIIFLSYSLNSSNFHQSEINTSMIRAMGVLIPCLAVPFAYAVFAVYRNRRSVRKEIELLKQAPKGSSNPKPAPKKSCEKLFPALRWAVLCIAVCSLVFGFLTGGTADVLTKAVNICTECVGLG